MSNSIKKPTINASIFAATEKDMKFPPKTQRSAKMPNPSEYSQEPAVNAKATILLCTDGGKEIARVDAKRGTILKNNIKNLSSAEKKEAIKDLQNSTDATIINFAPLLIVALQGKEEVNDRTNR